MSNVQYYLHIEGRCEEVQRTERHRVQEWSILCQVSLCQVEQHDIKWWEVTDEVRRVGRTK